MSEIKMLPLPKKAQLVNPYSGRGIPTYGHSDETLTDYARAVAEHNVAERDAEIEALRAKLDGAKARLEDVGKVTRFETVRAERLAEALQWYAEQVDGCRKVGSIGEPFRKELDRDGGKRARAALRDHDQEGKDE